MDERHSQGLSENRGHRLTGDDASSRWTRHCQISSKQLSWLTSATWTIFSIILQLRYRLKILETWDSRKNVFLWPTTTDFLLRFYFRTRFGFFIQHLFTFVGVWFFFTIQSFVSLYNFNLLLVFFSLEATSSTFARLDFQSRLKTFEVICFGRESQQVFIEKLAG